MLTVMLTIYNILTTLKALKKAGSEKDKKKMLRLQIAFVLKGLALAFNAIAAWLVGQPDQPGGN